eukprot:TRINITY_DN2000_c0_g1_i1.p2 TRINITY_DN2000_c0_g1~~TRINITY_DN2000_c0_g1_i1.p2  ORF type:complete len:217 (+),score=158.54 TRINITY_DN2000_c0_g1_i1:74-652(+)
MAPSALLPTYDDSPAIGKDFPSMSTTKHIKNTEYKAEGLRVVALVAKYDKGGCERVPELSKLADENPDVAVTCVFCDPEAAHVERFFEKAEFTFSDAVGGCHDEGGAVKAACKDLLKVPGVGIPHVFIVGKDGKVIWNEQFSQRKRLADGTLLEQLEKTKKGEALVSNGPAPVESDDEEEVEMEGDGDMSLF